MLAQVLVDMKGVEMDGDRGSGSHFRSTPPLFPEWIQRIHVIVCVRPLPFAVRAENRGMQARCIEHAKIKILC